MDDEKNKCKDLFRLVRNVFIDSSKLCEFSYHNPQPPTIWESIHKAKKQDIIITDDIKSHQTLQVF